MAKAAANLVGVPVIKAAPARPLPALSAKHDSAKTLVRFGGGDGAVRRQRGQRLLDAVKEMVRTDKAFKAKALEGVLRPYRFEPRKGDVEALAAKPRDRGGQHLGGGEIDLDDICRFDHQEADRAGSRLDQAAQRLIEI